MPEAGFPPKPEKKEEEMHKVEVEMNVEARKEVSVVEGKFISNALIAIVTYFWFFLHSEMVPSIEWTQYTHLMLF